MGTFKRSSFHQHTSVSNLLCTGAICMNTTKNFVPLRNAYTKLPPYLVVKLQKYISTFSLKTPERFVFTRNAIKRVS